MDRRVVCRRDAIYSNKPAPQDYLRRPYDSRLFRLQLKELCGVQNGLRGRHMADLFAVQVRKNRAGLPRLSFRFGPMSRSFLPIAPNTTWKPTFDV